MTAIYYQNIAAVTSELWPSMSNILAAPFRQIGRTPTAHISEPLQRSSGRPENVVVRHTSTPSDFSDAD